MINLHRPAIPSPHNRCMLFVDGENFAIRGRSYAEEHGNCIDDVSYHLRDVFLWIPDCPPAAIFNEFLGYQAQKSPPFLVRAYYYTCAAGDAKQIEEVEQSLFSLGFQPRVFKKTRQNEKAKGVDIALACDMLGHAFRDSFDVAVVISADSDYLPVIEEVKRLGKQVWLAFLNSTSLTEKHKRSFDNYIPLDFVFGKCWADLLKNRRQ